MIGCPSMPASRDPALVGIDTEREARHTDYEKGAHIHDSGDRSDSLGCSQVLGNDGPDQRDANLEQGICEAIERLPMSMQIGTSF